MACVYEAMGLALLNPSGQPAPYESRDHCGGASGQAILRLIEKNIRARDIITRKRLENASRVVACTGGSTDAALHYPAIAHRAGIKFDLFSVTKIKRDTPRFRDLRPAGRHVAKDRSRWASSLSCCRSCASWALCTRSVTPPQRGPSAMSLTRSGAGRSAGSSTLRPRPLTRTGSVVYLRGNLAPDGAIVKVAGLSSKDQFCTGPACVFEGEEDAFEAVRILGRTWAHESGAVMQLSKLAINTGYEAPAVYAWSRAVGYARATPIKGVESFNRSTPVSGPTFVDATIGGKRLCRGARLWTIAVSTFKAETYRFLRLERPSDEDRALGVCDAPGTMHLPAWADTEWLKQLVAEQMVTVRNKRGFGHQKWQKMRERNEALDCRVYARAAA